MGTVLRVDLASGKIEKEPLSERLRLNYLGGRGINSRILYDSVGTEVDALSPENILVFGTGPVVGTTAPSAGRITVTAKSPLTGILGDGNAGGHFSVEMKRAGYDHIVFTGMAEHPVYLWVQNDRVELRPANHLWGKTTPETDEAIHRELGDPWIKIASIGPGGENLVRYASIIFDRCHAVGRTGMGAVMGSKNLKAVAVRGIKGVQVARPESFIRLSKELQERIINSPVYKGLAYYGTPHFSVVQYRNGWMALKNGQINEWPDILKLGHRELKRDYFVKSVACTACPRHCGQAWVVREGKYAGLSGSKIEYGAIAGFGAGCLITDFGAVAKMNGLCDDYSLDVMEMGFTLSTLMEWYEKGLVTRDDTDGIDLAWGNAEGAIEMIHKVAHREGLGNLLAEGPVKAAEQIGRGAERCIGLQAKGMTYGQDDIRAIKGYALNIATSTRGADHLRGMPGLEMVSKASTPDILEKRFGTAEAGVPGSYKKAPIVVYTQNLCTLADCLEVCKYNTEFQGEAMSIEDLAGLFSLATGVEMDEKAISTAAERIYAVERAFSVREGMNRKDDILKGRWGSEPIADGPCKGDRIDPDKFGKLLDEYYRLRGWDSMGIPTSSALASLGLEDIAEELKQKARKS
ncbi:aldehyde ferredoxin oxidoreductase family protein [Chloroflexota bacterium]